MKILPLLLLAVAPILFGASSPEPSDDFSAHFYDDANCAEYIEKMDTLIDIAEAKIYESMEQEGKDKDGPKAKTKNGILMVYTITKTKDGMLVHFSVSRPPYLATAFGKQLVELFMDRSFWPKPQKFLISEHRVFHAIWIIPESDFSGIRAEVAKIRPGFRKSKDTKKIMARSLIKSRELE